jgi:hypothetical protein
MASRVGASLLTLARWERLRHLMALVRVLIQRVLARLWNSASALAPSSRLHDLPLNVDEPLETAFVSVGLAFCEGNLLLFA